jgi:hypothetical protein
MVLHRPIELATLIVQVTATVLRGGIPNTRNDQPVVDCANGYQNENQEEADEVEENCRQEGGADEEGG